MIRENYMYMASERNVTQFEILGMLLSFFFFFFANSLLKRQPKIDHTQCLNSHTLLQLLLFNLSLQSEKKNCC